MKLTFENKIQRAIAVILFIAFIMGMSYIFTSCSTPYGCSQTKGMVGYGPGSYGKH